MAIAKCDIGLLSVNGVGFLGSNFPLTYVIFEVFP